MFYVFTTSLPYNIYYVQASASYVTIMMRKLNIYFYLGSLNSLIKYKTCLNSYNILLLTKNLC